MKKRLLFFVLLITGAASYSRAQPSEMARAGREAVKEVLDAYRPKGGDQIEFQFLHQRHRFGDFYRPWQTDTQSLAGNLGIHFHEDPLFFMEDYYTSASADTQWLCYQLLGNEIWTQDSLIRDLGNLSSDFYLFRTIKYSPYFALRLFLDTVKAQFVSYRPGAMDTLWYEYLACPVKIIWDPQTREVQQVQYAWPDLSLGDRHFEVRYFGHRHLDGALYPLQSSTRERGILKDRIQIMPQLPPRYRFRDGESLKAALPKHQHRFPAGDTYITKYNNYVSFIDMEITGTRAMVVSFKDHFVVVGAPLQTNYGEMIYMKLKEIHPAKFVRYFIPGHHHLPFLGGIRGLVRRGATVLSPKGTLSHIREMVEAPHTIWKDLLSLNPAPLLLDSFEQQITLKDETLTMEVVDMGAASGEADHYLLFYFPELGLLYQQDLARVPAQRGGSREVHPGNRLLYDYVTERNWNVNIVAQGNGIGDKEWKNVFFLGELIQNP